MTTPLEAETRINESIARVQAAGYRLRQGRFGDEKCGCALGALMQDIGGRKTGESARAFAVRLFGVSDDFMWAFVGDGWIATGMATLERSPVGWAVVQFGENVHITEGEFSTYEPMEPPR